MKRESEEAKMKGLASSPAPVLEKKEKKKEKKRKKVKEEAGEEKLDLKALIHGHALFFDRLVELIPARFYLPHDEGAGKVWFHGLSKDAKASFKKQSRENLKMARKQRLEASPSSSSVSTLELLKKSIAEKKSNIEGDKGEPDAAPPAATSDGDGEQNHGGSVTYEELRQRLHRKIDELRGNRNTRDPVAGGKKGKWGKNQQRNPKQRDSGKGERVMNAGSGEKKPTEKNAEESAGEFAFGQVKIGGEQVGKKGKKRKGSKFQELERAKKLKQAMDDPDKGARVSKKHSWSAALNRAAGVKVHDDPKLLNQSIKKEKKRQQKSAKKWKDRMEAVEKNKSAKQQARSEHIAERARDKKMRRIAKREKKLMRPGFEGRKSGFINETST